MTSEDTAEQTFLMSQNLYEYKRLFTYDISQKRGFADPPSTPCRPKPEIDLPPSPQGLHKVVILGIRDNVYSHFSGKLFPGKYV